ncbi:MAG: hypothetical protein ACFB10_15755 [Salibacteraceae bacterium]
MNSASSPDTTPPQNSEIEPAEPAPYKPPRNAEWLFARLVTGILHPLIMPTLGMFLIFQFNSFITNGISTDMALRLFGWVFLNTFIVPVLVALYMLRTGMISTIHIVNREERWFPYILTGAFYFFTYYMLFARFGLHQALVSIMFGASVAVVVSFVVNFKHKVSIHMVGISGLVGAMFAVDVHYGVPVTPVLILFVFLTGLVGSSRLFLKAHQPKEVFLGFLVGFSCEFLAVLLEWG